MVVGRKGQYMGMGLAEVLLIIESLDQFPYTSPSLMHMLMNQLNKIAANWHLLGIQLEVPTSQLRSNISNFSEHLEAVLDYWLKNATPKHKCMVYAIQVVALKINSLPHLYNQDDLGMASNTLH